MRLDAVRAGVITAAFLVPVSFVAMQASGIEAGQIGERWTTPLVVVAIAGLGGAGARGLGTSWRRWPLVTIGAVVGLILWQ